MKVLVVGEKCSDIFVYGECSRLSPEAPIPVMNILDTVQNDGMAGNVVRNLKSIREEIYVELWSQHTEITKTRYVEKKSNHMFVRVDVENNIDQFILTYDNLKKIGEFDLVIVSDYNKGFLTDEHLETIGNSSKLSILDSKRKLTSTIVNSFSFVKLNESESKNNIDLLGCNNILTTLGSKGCRFNGELFPSPKPQETIDVSGAGDTFTASFIVKYFETKNVSQAIRYANDTSAKVVSKRGVATP